MAGLSVGSGGWMSNLIVFLITKFNIGSITATKINNVVYGCVCLSPVIGAIIADSFAGNFAVVSISSFIALLVIIYTKLISSQNYIYTLNITFEIICTPASMALFLSYKKKKNDHLSYIRIKKHFHILYYLVLGMHKINK